MARNTSMIVIVAVMIILAFSFMSSFGSKSELVSMAKVAVEKANPAEGEAVTTTTAPAFPFKTAAASEDDASVPVKPAKPGKEAALAAEKATSSKPSKELADDDVPLPPVDVAASVVKGGTIAPKLANETLKAELGRAAWKVLHTMMARFPDEPTEDESEALRSYIHLFSRLYPCGECAKHFQKLLKQFPPQTGSRNAAAGWACFVHNQVNERLKKPVFDCTKIGDFYDCGCGDEKNGTTKADAKDSKTGAPVAELKLEKDAVLKDGSV